jgi:hypothetical protein
MTCICAILSHDCPASDATGEEHIRASAPLSTPRVRKYSPQVLETSHISALQINKNSFQLGLVLLLSYRAFDHNEPHLN